MKKTKINRNAKRINDKAKRRVERKQARERKRAGEKAGSIAIHSRLPGLEGTEIGSMGVIVDSGRKETHHAEITVAVSNQRSGDTTVWIIETGFGGRAPRVGYQVMPENQPQDIPPITWVCEIPGPEQPQEARESLDERQVAMDAESVR